MGRAYKKEILQAFTITFKNQAHGHQRTQIGSYNNLPDKLQYLSPPVSLSIKTFTYEKYVHNLRINALSFCSSIM